MEARHERPRGGSAAVAAGAAFILVLVLLVLVALANAPVRTNPQIARNLDLYLAEVRDTALPFLGAVAVGGIVLGGLAARMVYRVWPNESRRREMLAGYAFVAPYLIVTLVFTIGVVLFAFYVSFTRYGIFNQPQWIGLDNYTRALGERSFLQALHNVLWYFAIVVPLQTGLAIILAVLLNRPLAFRNFFRTVFYAPSVTSSVVITAIFIWLYLRSGFINYFLVNVFGAVGIEWARVDFLGDPRGLIQLIVEAFGGQISSDLWYLRGPSIAWMAIMTQNIFTTAPTFMIMFLAALQDINPTVYEAASIDGATGWQRFRRITLPLLRPIIVLVVVLGTIGTLQIFDQVYLATSGGPLNTTNVPAFEIYTRALGKLGPIEMGYGAALAFILGIIIFSLTFVQRRLLERGTELY